MKAQITQVVHMFKPLKSTLNLRKPNRTTVATTIKLQARVKAKLQTTETLCCRKIMFKAEVKGKTEKLKLKSKRRSITQVLKIQKA